MSQDWHVAAVQLHRRVLETPWDALALALIVLHRPRSSGQEWPTCHGCDRDDRSTGDVVWPCRSYGLIAATMMHMADVEMLLTDMRQRREGSLRPRYR